MSVQRVIIQVPGASLQAQVSVREGSDVGLLLCHPYPLLGGSMRDPIVDLLFRAAVESPAFGCVLRYNQRGVGTSSGSKLTSRKGDLEDVAALVDFILHQLGGSNARVMVVGYSWGACLATRALACPRVTAYVGVSFPLGGLALVLQPRKYFADLCAATHVPRLLVIGTQDQYCKHMALQQLVLQQPGGLTYSSWAAQHRLQQPDPGRPAGDVQNEQQEQECSSSGTADDVGGIVQQAAPQQQAAVQRAGRHSASTFAPAPLVIWTYDKADHFWMDEGPRMAEEVMSWLQAVARSQAA